MNQSRYLITTPDQLTWKFDRPVIFLGEYCKLYNQKTIWNEMDAITTLPYGIGKSKKDADNTLARALEYKLLPRVCELLNLYHSSSHSQRYWQIIIGNWITRVIDALFNRISTLQQCLDFYEISGTCVYGGEKYSLAPLDSNAAIYLFNEGRWNNLVYKRIMHLTGNEKLITDIINEDSQNYFAVVPNVIKSDIKSGKLKAFRSKCKEFLVFISKLLLRDTDAFIASTYLPRMEVVKLNLALGQFPQIWCPQIINYCEKPNLKHRQDLSGKLAKDSTDHMEYLVSKLLFELMPTSYLENYKNVAQLALNGCMPKMPRFIFTSNLFDTDELFKFWSASKIEQGINLFIGQHGNYGVYRYLYPRNEEIIPDKFITWGFTDGLRQHTPAFIFRTVGSKTKDYNAKGNLLLIETSMWHRMSTFDTDYEFSNYFIDQIKFYKILSSEPKQKLIIRLHQAYKNPNGSFEDARWHDINPTQKLDKGSRTIVELIRDSRLTVHSYDSTGILETLSLNIPTLAFWQNELDHLRDSAIPYYQLLIDAGIVHLSAESAAYKVNEIWDNIEDWWQHASVQNARKLFCEKYARHSSHPVRDLLKIMKTN